MTLGPSNKKEPLKGAGLVFNSPDYIMKEYIKLRDQHDNLMIEKQNIHQKYDKLLGALLNLIKERGYEHSKEITTYDLEQLIMRATNA